MTDSNTDKVGIVAIGRNGGERLRRSLESVAGRTEPVVYVDSGSADGSVAVARATGVDAGCPSLHNLYHPKQLPTRHRR